MRKRGTMKALREEIVDDIFTERIKQIPPMKWQASRARKKGLAQKVVAPPPPHPSPFTLQPPFVSMPLASGDSTSHHFVATLKGQRRLHSTFQAPPRFPTRQAPHRHEHANQCRRASFFVLCTRVDLISQ